MNVQHLKFPLSQNLQMRYYLPANSLICRNRCLCMCRGNAYIIHSIDYIILEIGFIQDKPQYLKFKTNILTLLSLKHVFLQEKNH